LKALAKKGHADLLMDSVRRNAVICHIISGTKKIDQAVRAKVDKEILNTALELGFSYFFRKKDICNLKVRRCL